jgi:hypothetical protein
VKLARLKSGGKRGSPAGHESHGDLRLVGMGAATRDKVELKPSYHVVSRNLSSHLNVNPIAWLT